MGVCFLPEFSVTGPGVLARPLVDPEVEREVALETVAGRRFSPAVASFVRAIKAYPWPTVAGAATPLQPVSPGAGRGCTVVPGAGGTP